MDRAHFVILTDCVGGLVPLLTFFLLGFVEPADDLLRHLGQIGRKNWLKVAHKCFEE